MPDIDMHLYLSTNRDQSGVLVVAERQSGRELARFQALGRGDKGGGDTQMQVKGNTPTGTYRVTRVKSTAAWSASSYGPNGALELQPTSGRAKDAERLVKREGLLIHGGALGAPKNGKSYWRGDGQLRATQGCVRLSDANMRSLVDLISGAQDDPLALRSTVIEVTLTVEEHPASILTPAL